VIQTIVKVGSALGDTELDLSILTELVTPVVSGGTLVIEDMIDGVSDTFTDGLMIWLDEVTEISTDCETTALDETEAVEVKVTTGIVDTLIVESSIEIEHVTDVGSGDMSVEVVVRDGIEVRVTYEEPSLNTEDLVAEDEAETAITLTDGL
jgi:hypothetical protein